MAKLKIGSQRTSDTTDRKGSDAAKPPAPSKRCPRCLEMLAFERTRRSLGLNGVESQVDVFVCPACDARFHRNRADGRWREIT